MNRFRRHDGFVALGAIVAAAIVLITALLAGSSMSNMSRLRRTIASRSSYVDLEQGLVSTIGVSVSDYLSEPNNCSCAGGLKQRLDGLTVGASIAIKWLDDTRISELLADSNLPAEQRTALTRCQNNSTKLPGFLVDPGYQQGGQDCTIISNMSNFNSTAGYTPPHGVYFCAEFQHIAGSPPVPQDSMMDSDLTFAEMEVSMLNSEHTIYPATCRDYPYTMMQPGMGGVSARVYTTFYWNRKAQANLAARPFRHTVIFSLPVDQDPMWRFIRRLYHDGLQREATFEEIFYWWSYFHRQHDAGQSIDGIRRDIAHAVIYSMEGGEVLVRNWGYQRWFGSTSGHGDRCTGEIKSHRGNIQHVIPCGDWGLTRDLYATWDYALVFGRDFGGGKGVWAANGGNSCCGDTDPGGNRTATCQAGCNSACAATITRMYQVLYGRGPNRSPDDPGSEANAYYNTCIQGPWYWWPPYNDFVGGTEVWNVGYQIGQSREGSEFIVKDVFQQYLRRAPRSDEMSQVADQDLAGSGKRILDIAWDLASSQEYYDLRP